MTQGMGGYFAVLYDNDGPVQTGIGRYKTIDDAKAEAIQWSQCEGVAVDFDSTEWKHSTRSAAEEAMADKQRRHSWVRIREHNYMCKRCGMGKINIQTGEKSWEQNYLFPDGTEGRRERVPPCEDGEFTASRTEQLAAMATTDGLEAAREKIADEVENNKHESRWP